MFHVLLAIGSLLFFLFVLLVFLLSEADETPYIAHTAQDDQIIV